MSKLTAKLLPLNLQYFAEEVETPVTDDEQTTPAEADTSDNETTQVDKQIPYDRFKAKVDEANDLKKRLATFETAQAEEQRKSLEEQDEWKTLYEQTLEQNKTLQADALDVKKDHLLRDAGYSDSQTGLLRKLIEGSTDEEIAVSIAQLKEAIPTQQVGVDPSPFNSRKDNAETTDKEEIGRNAAARILSKIKL